MGLVERQLLFPAISLAVVQADLDSPAGKKHTIAIILSIYLSI